MFSLLLLLLVGATIAQESGDYAQENSDQLMKAANDEGENFPESFDGSYEEEECDEKSDRMEPDVTVKAEGAVCPKEDVCVYHLFLVPRTFGKAQRACRCLSGSLSSIHNSNTNMFMRKFLGKACRNSSYVWIGVWKRNSCSPYRNVDRSRLNYTNWASGQRKTRGQWCTAMNTRTGKWVSLRCGARLPFVCTY